MKPVVLHQHNYYVQSKDTPFYHAPPPIANHTHTIFWISEYYKIFKGYSSKNNLNLVYKKMDRVGVWAYSP